VEIAMAYLGYSGTGKFSWGTVGIGYILITLVFQYFIYEIRNPNDYYFYYNMGLSKYQDNFIPNHVKITTIISLFCDKENGSLIKSNEWIKPMLGKKSNQLSGGEKRLLEILLIIHSNAKYILIDEPFNGIAPIYKEDIKNLIKEQSKNKGFIITDHDYWNILDLSTRIILMHDGGTKEIKSTDELEYWGYVPEGILI
jgi:ABC-type sugar transport system ATPase subunit